MLVATVAEARKRGLVAASEDAAPVVRLPSAAGQLRALRLEALGQFAPLLAGAAMLSCLIVAATLWGTTPPLLLASWTLTVIASGWLVAQRLRQNAALWFHGDVPARTGFENGAMLALLVTLWGVLPIGVYAQVGEGARTVIAGTVFALICGALAVAAAPVVALTWAALLTLGLGAAVFVAGDHFWPEMILSVGLHFAFIALVVRRIDLLAEKQAERQAGQQAEVATAAQLMREYEERGTSCLWHTDAQHVIDYATPAIAALVGRPGAPVVGVSLPALIGGNAALGEALASHTAFSGIEVEPGNGAERRAIAFSGTPILSADGAFLGFRGACSDITDARSSERRLRQLASLDVLTELPNRMRMRELLGEALLAARASGRPCAMLMLDLDGFKPVNDTFGHPKGDALLKTVAARLVGEVGDAGIVGRLGGDEFGIVLHDARNRYDMDALADRLVATVSAPYTLDGVSVRVGVSIGSACGPIDGDTVDELVTRADLALYEAKAAGRGTYRHFERGMQTEAENRLRLEHDLRQALPLGQFRLYYQPLVRTDDQSVAGFEALLRWQHPVRGFVSPADFVPLAEEVGLIDEIGAWVIRTAVRDCARWGDAASVAVNLSPIQLRSPHLPATISEALAQARLPANRLELEVTESVFMGDSASSLDVLRRLRALGVRIALDDFGTGYSSLGYLNRTIFNKLKIDGSFVRGAATRTESIAIIQAIVTLANSFGMTITAEGVETQDDFRRMVGLGCHQMQGYLFGRPVPFERAAELVRGAAAPPRRAVRG